MTFPSSISTASSILPSSVEYFQIDSSCNEMYPCGHFCTLELSDGRKVTVEIDGHDIHSLINAIAKEKIHCKYQDKLEHFMEYKTFKAWKKKSPEQILNKIFDN